MSLASTSIELAPESCETVAASSTAVGRQLPPGVSAVVIDAPLLAGTGSLVTGSTARAGMVTLGTVQSVVNASAAFELSGSSRPIGPKVQRTVVADVALQRWSD